MVRARYEYGVVVLFRFFGSKVVFEVRGANMIGFWIVVWGDCTRKKSPGSD